MKALVALALLILIGLASTSLYLQVEQWGGAQERAHAAAVQLESIEVRLDEIGSSLEELSAADQGQDARLKQIEDKISAISYVLSRVKTRVDEILFGDEKE